MPQFSLKELLGPLSEDELEQLKQEILKQGDGGSGGGTGRIIAQGVGQGLSSFARGSLLALQNRPVSELDVRSKGGGQGEFQKLLQREQLKNLVDPSRIKAKRDLQKEQANQERLQSQVTGGQSVSDIQDAEIVEDTAVSLPGSDKAPPRKIIERDEKGNLIEVDNPDFEIWQNSRQEISKSFSKIKSDVFKGRLVNTNNLELIAGVMRDLAQVYADAHEEGGAGGIVQSTMAGAAQFVGDLPDFLGGAEVGSKFSASGAFPGKRMELILKLMPMLTQQATKPEGSVRIITGVLEALGQTIPELNTAIATADRQLEESLRTFYRFARAAELMGQSLEQSFPGREPESLTDNEIQSWAQSVASRSQLIEITGGEKNALDEIINVTLSPIRNVQDGAVPPGAEFFSPSQQRFFDAQGNPL